MASDPSASPTKRGLVGFGDGAGGEARLPAPPTQARGAEKRERLYRSAIARFAAIGVAETRVEDVIGEAKVSWATFFRYFPRKEDVLIEAAARHFRARVLPLAERAIADRRTRIRRATEQVFAALLEPAELTPQLHSQAFVEVFGHPARFAAMVGGASPAPMISLVAELLAEGQGRGEIDPQLDIGVAAPTVGAATIFPAVQAAAAGVDPAQTIAEALDILWTGLAARG